MSYPEKITVEKNENLLLDHLRAYQEEALTLGATRAAQVRTDDIIVDERVVGKCRVPICFMYNKSANCPPHAPKPDQTRRWLGEYAWAIFFTMETPLEIIMMRKTDPKRIAVYRSLYDLIARIEYKAFYDGHYLAMGFASGSCRRTFCSQHETCSVLDGQGCRFPLLARPSMEAVGMDVFGLAAKMGWPIYPIGRKLDPSSVPHALLAGIVLIA